MRSISVTWLLCDALINISKDGQRLEPGLAESWTLSPDGLQAVIKLRTGVMFHDGTPLDARAVKTSFERHFRPGHELYSAEPRNTKEQMLRELIEDIQVQDSLGLVFRLKYPGFHYLSQIEVVSPPAVAKRGKEFGRSPVCTGPFKFESWSRERIDLAANEKYWAARPRIDRVVFRFIPEGKVVVEGLIRGEVDFSPSVLDPVLFERARESPHVKLVPMPGLNIYYLGFYTERPPFNNPLLRQAVVQGINIQRAALFLLRGAALSANGPLSPAMKGYDPAVSQVPHDPEAAKTRLSQAGVGPGLTVGLVHNHATTVMSEMAGTIQSDLRRIGIKVEFLGKPSWPDLVKAVRMREGDMFLYSWHVRAPYPERLLIPLFHSRSAGTTNLTHYKNPELDKLLDEALGLPEGPMQTKMYSQIQQLIVQAAPMAFLWHGTRMAAHTDRVQGLELNLGSLPHDKLVKVDLASRE